MTPRTASCEHVLDRVTLCDCAIVDSLNHKIVLWRTTEPVKVTNNIFYMLESMVSLFGK